MIPTIFGRFLGGSLVFVALAASAEILGTKPTYGVTAADSFPNIQAVGRVLWMPGLDEGYVPQGLTVVGDAVLVAAYRSADPKVNTGPCRVYRVEMASGKDSGSFDLPEGACTHAGGLAYIGDGMLLLADTRNVFRIDLAKSFEARRAVLKGHVKLSGLLYGSYAAFDGKDAWIGVWAKDRPERARFYRLPPRFFEDYDGQTVDESRAAETLVIPMEVQGAAFGRDGSLWLSMSNSRHGVLYKVDRATGNVLARHDMVNGIEDIEFDGAGKLWAVSEAGSKKYMNWPRHFPVIFEIDVAKLK